MKKMLLIKSIVTITYYPLLIDILRRNTTEKRKGEFDKVITKRLQLNETQINDELINEFIESTNEVTNTVKF